MQRILAAANSGEVEAEYALGVFHRDGHHVEKSPVFAREMFSRAAQKGHVIAQVELGYACALGIGGPQNADEALRWYRAAADSGNAIAQYNVGGKYDQGLGVPRDSELALSEPAPIQWTPRSAMSVIHGRPVRSLATNRELAVGG